MGIGKYFHRDKSDSPKETKNRSRATSFGAIDPSLQTSRYEAMPPAGLPQTGTYPIKGNNSTAAVAGQKSAYRQSVDPRPNQTARPDTAPAYPITTTRTTTTTTTTAPRIETPKMNPQSTFSDYRFFERDQPSVPDRGASLDNRKMQQGTGLEQNFAGMSLKNDTNDHSATPPPIPFYGGSGSASSRIDPRVDSIPRNDPKVRMVNQVGQQLDSPSYAKTDVTPHQRYPTAYDDQGISQSYAQPSRSPRGIQNYDQASRSPRGHQGYDQNSVADQGYVQASGVSSRNPQAGGGFGDVDEAKAARRASIPRKQVGTSGHTPNSSITSSSPISSNYPSQTPTQPPPPVPKHRDLPTEQPAYQNLRPPLQESASPQDFRYYDAQKEPQYNNRTAQQQHQDSSAIPQGLNYGRGTRDQADHFQSKALPLFPRAQPASEGLASRSGPQDIVQRAQTNTKDTEVIEKIAPGKPHLSKFFLLPPQAHSTNSSPYSAITQEHVIEKVHHKREEVITREIHTHDVYHRILPIIDVEVLPPRHFLPVEGGGLVEIGADEVPGRAKNWVIAETASKIPSDQPAPKGVSRFTAREFPGTEGDRVEYVTEEGVRRTEETWVHPPELETGGRDTGQTWPMVFGRETGKEKGHTRRSGEGRRRAKSRSSAAEGKAGGLSSSY
ncbi:MAG: hypothetical protein Q9195_009510 [Heterodermia aff. obscurata]